MLIQARITLARAVYSSAQILLLDDVLSALDVHTAQWVARNCLGGDLLKNRTVILVTNNILLCEPYANYVISLGGDGRIVSQGTVDDALKNNATLRETINAVNENAEKEEDPVDDPRRSILEKDKAKKKVDGKLMVAEEMADGHLSWATSASYLCSEII